MRNRFFLNKAPLVAGVLFIFCLLGNDKLKAQEIITLSLCQAEELALENNYDLLASVSRLQQSYYGYRSTKTYFHPAISYSSNANMGSSMAKGTYRLDNLLQVTQPIFDKTAAYLLKEAEINWERQRLQVQQQICETLFKVRNAFHALLLHQAHLAVDKMILEIWEAESLRQERYLNLGSAIALEFTQAQLQLKRARIDCCATESDIRSSQIRLLTLLGLSPGIVLHLTEKESSFTIPQWRAFNLEEWKKLAFQYSPQLKQEQLNYALMKTKISRIKAERLPTLSAYASAGHNYVTNGFTFQHSAGVGVNIDWMLYDPTHRPRIKQAKEEEREAVISHNQIKIEVEAMIYDGLNRIEKSYQAYLVSNEEAFLAEESMRMATKKQELGLITPFEYRDVIETLHEAKQRVNQAIFDVRNNYDLLVQQVGFDLRS